MRKGLLLGALLACFGAACGPATTSGGTGTNTTPQPQPQASTVSLQVHNGSSQTICFLYISPVSDPNWGPDQLGSRTLEPNETDTYTMPAGSWDLKGEDCSHNQLFVMRNQTIAGDATLTLHE